MHARIDGIALLRVYTLCIDITGLLHVANIPRTRIAYPVYDSRFYESPHRITDLYMYRVPGAYLFLYMDLNRK